MVSGYLLEMKMTKSRIRKQKNRENRIRLSKHNWKLRAIAKKKLEKTENKAKVLDQTVDNV